MLDLPAWLILSLTSVLISLIAVIMMAVLLSRTRATPDAMARGLEDKHLAMVRDLNAGLNALGDRLTSAQSETLERLRTTLTQELTQARSTMGALQVKQVEELSANRETLTRRLGELSADLQSKHDQLRAEVLTKILEKLAEQNRAEQELIQSTLRHVAAQLAASLELLTRTTDSKLEQISGKVHERLEEGFRKTNETFVNVMARLATIDEAQRKIDGLTSNVVTLQELLGDKRSRGAFGEVQLESLVRNMLPPSAYEFQHTLSNGNRADCVLLLPEPTGLVAVDAKFPLENYHRMFDYDAGEGERLQAQRDFRADIRRHVEDIADKYIIPGETSDGAMMFVPAEAVFAEIHAYHREVVDYAMQRRVWIVSPTTMMAVLNTARAVLKDVETRRQVHIIKDELGKLGREFARFDQRMKRLADHIRQAHEDAEQVRVTSDKITRRFEQIERVELEHLSEVEQLERELLESPPEEPQS
ncbi:MAG TPA: DNA recombination protein RmuC [Burkholderiales bacterium]|jgi:DNA recombination protein RmuC|nr:DNA recombination protein RmuC [Burkholderiales bacterium]